MQNTSHLLMIQPVRFEYNAATAVNNAFQVAGATENVQTNALNEFNTFVSLLRNKGVDVTVVEDTIEPHTPDSIFPNNWISFHQNGTVVLYPMFADNRRMERKAAVMNALNEKFTTHKTIDLTPYENEGVFLEGTGSMVLDREKHIAYACISPRTDKTLFNYFCEKLGYTPCAFTALDNNGGEIYHTNVMMCVADKYVVICLDTITNPIERAMVEQTITASGKQIIEISLDQMNRFAGNMLQVINAEGKKLLIMSSQAYQSLLPAQIQTLEEFNELVHASLNTIETNGGGSARCMMAEVFLPLKK